MVEFNRITKIYDNLISAVYDVSFKLDEGEFVFLIGPSGSGKTTIIKMLIRDEVPTDGSIYFNDVDITKISRSKVYKLRREIGVVFQDFKLVPDKTAYENVAFAMEAAGKKNKEIKETVPYVLDIVGLSNRMKAFPRQLSGGEQQRVAIARAIANNPKILIADEPTGNLDPASSWDIVQVLTKINNWGTTVIMSTHGTDIVNSLNKRVIQMDQGRIIRDDNKGQYELIHSFEEETLKNLETKDAPKPKETKKKVFQVKINKDGPESKPVENEVIKEDQPEVVEEAVPLAVEKKRSFSGLFDVFKRNKGKQQEIHESIVEALSEEAPKKELPVVAESIPSATIPPLENKAIEPEAKSEVEPAKSDSKAPAQMAGEIKESKPEKKEKDLGEVMNNAEKVSIDDMNLPKPVKNDLKAAGFKTAQDIINAGPDELAKNLVIDPEEVVLISKEIKKIAEK